MATHIKSDTSFVFLGHTNFDVKRIAFVTCSVKPDFAPDDLETVDALVARGAIVQAVPWDIDFSDWQQFDKVVLRSCWNYHLHPDKFLTWLSNMKRQHVKLINSIEVARWNLHKSYLEKLSRQGVTLPETVWLSKGDSIVLQELLLARGWNKAVVKPAISATAYKTFLTSVDDSAKHQGIFNDVLKNNDVLVQQFIPEVHQGEWSLIFLDKQFSHAVLKKPKAGDFRVQDDYGGTAHSQQPTADIIQQAEKILSLISEQLLYTRVDGVVVNNQFLLMELELIEPVLFFKQHKAASARFADLLMLH